MALSNTAPNVMPVGTILPFAGDASKTSNFEEITRDGWLPCDGSPMYVTDFPDLYAVIGTCHGGQSIGNAVVTFNLPDLATFYVRGVDLKAGVDPDKSTRTPAAAGGNSGNEVGSFQGFATTAPHAPFATDLQGIHTHTVAPVTTSYNHAWGGGPHEMAHVNGGGSGATASGGAHTHAVTGGGDPETRPVTLCMTWIIRAQAA